MHGNILPAAEVVLQWCKIANVFEQSASPPGESGNQQFHQETHPFQRKFEPQQIWQIYDGVECKLCYNQHLEEMKSPPQG